MKRNKEQRDSDLMISIIATAILTIVLMILLHDLFFNTVKLILFGFIIAIVIFLFARYYLTSYWAHYIAVYEDD